MNYNLLGLTGFEPVIFAYFRTAGGVSHPNGYSPSGGEPPPQFEGPPDPSPCVPFGDAIHR